MLGVYGGTTRPCDGPVAVRSVVEAGLEIQNWKRRRNYGARCALLDAHKNGMRLVLSGVFSNFSSERVI